MPEDQHDLVHLIHGLVLLQKGAPLPVVARLVDLYFIVAKISQHHSF